MRIFVFATSLKSIKLISLKLRFALSPEIVNTMERKILQFKNRKTFAWFMDWTIESQSWHFTRLLYFLWSFKIFWWAAFRIVIMMCILWSVGIGGDLTQRNKHFETKKYALKRSRGMDGYGSGSESGSARKGITFQDGSFISVWRIRDVYPGSWFLLWGLGLGKNQNGLCQCLGHEFFRAKRNTKIGKMRVPLLLYNKNSTSFF